jgi:chorismate synthase
MSHNSFGHLFRFTTWGESHGPAIGCVVDGCPPLIPLTEADIQADLDRRKPGQSKYTTQRREADEVKILSGVMVDEDGVQKTTGTPDRPDDREHRSALQGLRRDQDALPPRPCRLHL